MLQFYQEFRLFFCLSLTVFLNATSFLSEGNLLVYGLTSEETFSKTMQGWLKTQGTLKRVHNNRITINRRRLPASEYHYPIELLLFFTHRETLILAGLSVICYIVTAVVNPTVVHR